MDFSFSDDQVMFQEAVRDLLANECPPEVVRAAWENESGRTDGVWTALAEMGVVGMTAPESAGGLGMDETDLVLLLEEAGRAALPEPLLEHTAVGIPTLAEAGGSVAEAWMEQAAAGEATLGAGPEAGYAVGAAACDLVLLIGDQVRAVPVDGASLVEHRSIDWSRRLFEVDGEAVALDADPELAFDRAVGAAAAQCVGVAQHLLDATVEYVAQRYQFGKPVGTYQAVKHHLANTALKIEFARPASRHA
ncbi:MAG: acyl-CoA dehydrogenase, partial [Acidimicrobiia bacterium]|nr:acyl-CoA dehydrogenase [Acidimicrobiia bacterium]